MIPIENNYSYYKLLNWGQAIVYCLSGPPCLSDLKILNNKNKRMTNVRLPYNKVQKVCNSLNIRPFKILQRTKLFKSIILRNFCYVTFYQKVNIKRDI